MKDDDDIDNDDKGKSLTNNIRHFLQASPYSACTHYIHTYTGVSLRRHQKDKRQVNEGQEFKNQKQILV